MSTSLAADVQFDFTFPACDPATPPRFTFDPSSLLEIPYQPGHSRSRSQASSVYSIESTPSECYSVNSVSTRRTTPSRSPIRQHGPILLPKIRSQDRAIDPNAAPSAPAPKRQRTSPAPTPKVNKSAYRPGHQRSYTNPESISFMPSPAVSFTSQLSEDCNAPSLLCSPVNFAQHDFPSQQIDCDYRQRASSVNFDNSTFEKYAYPTYRHMPAYTPAAQSPPHSGSTTPTLQPAPTMVPVSQQQQDMSASYFYQPQQQYAPRAQSPLAPAASLTPEPQTLNLQPAPSTTLMTYLTAPNPAPSLVRTISFPLRDPNTKHFWWDVRQIRPWTAFSANSILSLPGASALLSCPVPETFLPTPMASARHPETESALHSIYANFYLPKLNSALGISSTRPLQLSVPSKSGPHAGKNGNDNMFVATIAGDASSAAAIFGGKPSARVVGLVKSFDRFNTGMRVEGNVKKVEYLRGLAHLHHVMREHGCRYGFILTEIELVVVRNGAENTPHFGFCEVSSVQLAAADGPGENVDEFGNACAGETQLTACLALWGLCMMAADEPAMGVAHWRSEIGAPAEGTRRKALARDVWMPQPQLAEKREAKRARGWVWPEDAVGRKELGKRGVRYGAC